MPFGFTARVMVLAVMGMGVIPSSLAGVRVTDAWIGEVPPTSPVAAAYLTLHNTGRHAMVLASVQSPVAERIEWHDVAHHDGQAHMMQRASPVLAAGQREVLQPGSSHLMLIGVREPLPLSRTVELTLHWQDGSRQRVLASVRPRPLPGPHAGSTHHHSH